MNEEDAAVRRGKFNRGFAKLREKVTLIFGVSVGNEKQSGNDLMSFVDLVNQNKEYISGIEVMLTGYLHRYYTSETEALSFDEKYIQENESTLSLLQVPYKVTRWQDICADQRFIENREQIDRIYASDEGFQIKVGNTVKKHSSKADDATVRKYLLEEATFFLYREGYLTYPADKLNLACMHIMENYSDGIKFVPYALIGQSKKKTRRNTPPDSISPQGATPPDSPPHSPPRVVSYAPSAYHPPAVANGVSADEIFMCCSQASILMQRFGIHRAEDRKQFFSRYIDKTSECLSGFDQALVIEAQAQSQLIQGSVNHEGTKKIGIGNGKIN